MSAPIKKKKKAPPPPPAKKSENKENKAAFLTTLGKKIIRNITLSFGLGDPLLMILKIR